MNRFLVHTEEETEYLMGECADSPWIDTICMFEQKWQELEKATAKVGLLVKDFDDILRHEGKRVQFTGLYDPEKHAVYTSALAAMEHHMESINQLLVAIPYQAQTIINVVKIHHRTP